MVATPQHYNDWPNSQGFDVTYEEREPVELEVTGHIPSYAAGTLFRTGAGGRSVKSEKSKPCFVNHWFDQLSVNHRFQIHPPTEDGHSCKVTYKSRSTCDGLIAKIKKTGNVDGITFGAKYDPCMTIFQKIQSLFRPAFSTSTEKLKPDELNIAVTMSCNFPGLSKKGERVESNIPNSSIMTICNKTDASIMQMLDPETLAPIGVARQSVLHPDLKGVLSSAHAEFDPITGDVFNYNLDFSRGKGIYRIFTVSASTGKTSILATITAEPAYLHSSFLTENYFILCVWNSSFTAGGASILWKRNLVDAMTWDTSRPARWYVVDRKHGKGVIATYESDPFYCFHTINAYEEIVTQEDGTTTTDIIADLSAFENLDILKKFYLENLVSDSPTAVPFSDPGNSTCHPSIHRYRLSSVTSPSATPRKAFLDFRIPKPNSLDLPTINPTLHSKKHRYVYGMSDTGLSSFIDGITKLDCQTHDVMRWSQHGQTAGEAIFIADPAAQHEGGDAEEDDGVLLSVVLDGTSGTSYLMVLDAKSMVEVGRASLKGPIGFGFHGIHVGSKF